MLFVAAPGGNTNFLAVLGLLGLILNWSKGETLILN